MTDRKICRDCGIEKPLSEFHREKRKADGRRVNCKACRTVYMADRYTGNREEILQRQRDNPRDPVALDAYQRAYRVRNRDRIAAKNRRWHEENRDRALAYHAAYYEANREGMAERNRQWRHRNHDHILATNRERVALKRAQLVDRGITIDCLRERDGDDCAYCGVSMLFGRTEGYVPTKASVDHVVPLVAGGPHSFENVVLACLRCNIRKRDRSADEWRSRAEGERDPEDLHQTAS